jgi:hypothetical protein
MINDRTTNSKSIDFSHAGWNRFLSEADQDRGAASFPA